jgi:hypothetical protein
MSKENEITARLERMRGFTQAIDAVSRAAAERRTQAKESHVESVAAEEPVAGRKEIDEPENDHRP